MNLAALRQRTREFLDDYEGIPRFSDVRIDAALNESQIEACKRSDLIVSTVVIAMTNGVGIYTLPDTAMKVKRVKYKARVLTPVLISQMDVNNDSSANWQAVDGTPSSYMIDAQTHEILLDKFVSTVSVDDKLEIVLISLPTVPLVLDTDAPQIADHLTMSLCYWAVSLLLSDSDPDTQDPNKVERFAAKYAAVFGEPITALALNQRINNTRVRARARFL